ncbi:MAG TPA: PDR/VanB family oxidoreductase, partial [Ramlibacter sp.]|nr:PDR/VanB family oxidoreductase [Ramlibacter sp.]
AQTGADDAQASREVLVRAMAWEADDVLSLTLAAPDGQDLPRWEPGAHIDLLAPGGVTAQYSLCGDVEAPTWRIAVLLQPDGRGVSRYIHQQLRPGQLAHVRGPRNHFRLLPSSRYLFIAGGIGITPILPMVAAAQRAGSQWRLVYGGRSRRSMSFTVDLEHRGRQVQLFPEDEVGRPPLQTLLSGLERDTLVYCCGPEPLIASVQSLAQELLLAPPVVERFSAAPDVRSDGEESAFVVVLARSGLAYPVPADRSIAQVLLEHGVALSTSCLQGICGSCETRVLAGAIDHRDALLTPAERERQDTMMVCVSRASGSRLTLDL